jgi:D-serine dehydratase
VALEVAAEVSRSPGLALRGVEGFEGLLSAGTPEAMLEAVRGFLDKLVAVARECERRGLFAPGEVLLSAGGSNFYDLVVERFSLAKLGRPARIVVRSGCYLTQDSQLYRQAHERLHERSPRARELGPGLQSALQVWSYVQSRPEPTRAVLSFGRRDAGFDCGLPQPLLWHRPGASGRPQPIPAGHTIAALNDQHALLDLPADSPLAVGDLVACGISHPCTTFDKWQFIPVVDDDYLVVDGVRTFF